jgi:SAM-dependent methyltransferase
VVCADLARFEDFALYKNELDSVLCLNVLEHVEDDRAALSNMFSVLRPGGRAIVLVPEGMSVYGTLDEVLGHHRRYSEEELRSKFAETGFHVETVIHFNRPTRPAWFMNGRIFKRRRFSRFQVLVFDRLVWLWRKIDRVLPWKPTSIIAVGLRPY